MIYLFICSNLRKKGPTFQNIHFFDINHNTPWLAPKILRKYCFQGLLVGFKILREIGNNAFGDKQGVLWECESSELAMTFLTEK